MNPNWKKKIMNSPPSYLLMHPLSLFLFKKNIKTKWRVLRGRGTWLLFFRNSTCLTPAKLPKIHTVEKTLNIDLSKFTLFHAIASEYQTIIKDKARLGINTPTLQIQ